MSDKIEVVSTNVSKEKGTIKEPVAQIEFNELGIIDDAHAGDWHRQISMLGQESVERFALKAGRTIAPGEFAENLTLRGLDFSTLRLLDRFRFGEVELEMTQIGKKCHGDSCAIFREVGACVMPKEGVFCRVIHGGTVRSGDAVEYLPKHYRFWVITLSDRASRGEYSDRSGPRVVEHIEAFAEKRHGLRAEINTTLLADDAEALAAELTRARKAGADVIITTGGTGVGPRDIAPEVVSDFCDKLVPGVMEAIRLKYGQKKPNALLSRSVAGVAGSTLVYAIPGSVRAVDEYLNEIVTTMPHLLHMLVGLDNH